MDAGGVFELLKTTRREIFSVVRHGSGRNTSRMMQLFERTYGSDITTRNWNTIEKVVSMADAVAVT
jgi:uncharacterized protein (DUF1697 family)